MLLRRTAAEGGGRRHDRSPTHHDCCLDGQWALSLPVRSLHLVVRKSTNSRSRCDAASSVMWLAVLAGFSPALHIDPFCQAASAACFRELRSSPYHWPLSFFSLWPYRRECSETSYCTCRWKSCRHNSPFGAVVISGSYRGDSMAESPDVQA
jgi:hypothetical protein